MSTQDLDLALLGDREYPYGFVTPRETEVAPKGLSEEVVRWISAKKEEPSWLLEVAACRLPQLGDAERAPLAERGPRPHRLPGPALKLRQETLRYDQSVHITPRTRY